MKKKLLLYLMVFILVFSFSACSNKDDVSSPQSSEQENAETSENNLTPQEESITPDNNTVNTESPSENETTDENQATPQPETTYTPQLAENIPDGLSDNLFDFQVAINGVVYQFPMMYKEFESMGWNYDGNEDTTSRKLMAYEYISSESWIYDEIEVFSKIANPTINGLIMEDAIVAGLDIDSYYFEELVNKPEVIMPGGIQLDVATRDDIVAVYGAPTEERNYDYDLLLYYEYGDEQFIEFYIDSDTGVLDEIIIENITDFEGSDNSVSTEVPDVVQNYVAPQEASNDLYGFTIDLEGHLYTLPCPVSEFFNDGFVKSEAFAPPSLPAGSDSWMYINYNDNTYYLSLKNYTDKAVTLENCFVIRIDTEYNENLNLSTPCNITLGTTETELLELIKDYGYTTNASGDYTFYRINNPDGEYHNFYEIAVNSGVVVNIYVSTKGLPQ